MYLYWITKAERFWGCFLIPAVVVQGDTNQGMIFKIIIVSILYNFVPKTEYTVGEKRASTKHYLWSKTTLITGSVGGAGAGHPT